MRTSRGLILALAGALVLGPAASAASAASTAVESPARSAAPATSGLGITHFEWTADGASVTGDSAIINSTVVNGQPGDVLFVTPNPYRGATCPCIAVAPLPVIGVRYHSGKWAVVTENKSAMPSPEAFNVLAAPADGGSVFTLKATKASITGDHLLINLPLTNNKPSAIIQVTQVVNPNGKGAGVYNPHPVGVRYYSAKHKWAVFNEDGAKIPAGASFSILVGTKGTGGGSAQVAKATAADIRGATIEYSNAKSNGAPQSMTFATPDWNPGGKGGVTTKIQSGVSYYTPDEKWLVYSEGLLHVPPLGTSYNLLIFSIQQQPVTAFAVTANSTATSGDAAIIDSRYTAGQPGDLLFVTPNPYKGFTCPCLVVPSVPAIGVQYNAGLAQWQVVTENQSAMPSEETFNVLAVPDAGSSVFVFKTAKSNTSGDRALINWPRLNGKPGAVMQVTQVVNPGGSNTEVFNPHPVGVRYDSSRHQWAVFNEDGAKMQLGASFNILVGTSVSGGAASQVLTVTKTNTIGHLALFGNSKSNGQPTSLTFVTPDWNPGGKGGVSFPFQPGVFYYTPDTEWSVFGESLAKAPHLGSAFNLLIYPGS